MSWQEKSLDELGCVSRGKSKHRPRDAAHLYGGSYPFIQTGDVKHSNLYITNFSQTYSEEGLAQSKIWKAGTLCITIAANIADTAILGIDACFPDSIIGFIPDPEKADVRFVKYLFDALLKKRFQKFTQGAAQDNLSQSKLLSLKFPVPSLKTQERIADILSKYDDLIENNQRRIELLETSARLLYREWFVYFRFPGHEHTPIINGVPEGWKRGRIGDIAKVSSGYAFKSADWKESGYPVIKIKNIIGNGSVDLINCDFIDEGVADKCSNFVLSPSNLIIAMTGATVGKVGIMPKSENKYYLNQRVGVFKNIDIQNIEYVLFSLFMEDSVQSQILNYASGAAQPNISAKQIESISMLVPNTVLIKLYLDTVHENFFLRLNLIEQNQKLKQARDLLLPRLMNGEISV